MRWAANVNAYSFAGSSPSNRARMHDSASPNSETFGSVEQTDWLLTTDRIGSNSAASPVNGRVELG